MSLWSMANAVKQTIRILEAKRLEDLDDEVELSVSVTSSEDEVEDVPPLNTEPTVRRRNYKSGFMDILERIEAENVSEPVVDTFLEPTTVAYPKSVAEPVTEVVPEPVVETVPEPVTEVVPEPEPVEDHYCAEKSCKAKIVLNKAAGLCAGCNLVYYCNQDCQKKDWKAGHKFVCNSNANPPSPTETAAKPLPPPPPPSKAPLLPPSPPLANIRLPPPPNYPPPPLPPRN